MEVEWRKKKRKHKDQDASTSETDSSAAGTTTASTDTKRRKKSRKLKLPNRKTAHEKSEQVEDSEEWPVDVNIKEEPILCECDDHILSESQNIDDLASWNETSFEENDRTSRDDEELVSARKRKDKHIDEREPVELVKNTPSTAGGNTSDSEKKLGNILSDIDENEIQINLTDSEKGQQTNIRGTGEKEVTWEHGKKDMHQNSETESNIENFEINPLHLSWRISATKKKSLKEKGVKIKGGPWSNNEVKLLTKNVETYLKKNGLTDAQVLVFSTRINRKSTDTQLNTASDHFFKTVARGIDRPLFNIYRRLIRMYDPSNYIGNWSMEEVEMLLRYYSIYGGQWTKIGELLGRSGASVNHKFTKMKNRHLENGVKEVKWTSEEIEKLNAAVRAVTNTDFNSQIICPISWVSVSEFVGSRSPDQCREKWLSYVCWLNDKSEVVRRWGIQDDIDFIERLYPLPVVEVQDIDWLQIAANTPNCPSYEWLRNRFRILWKKVPNYHDDCDLDDALDYLYNVHCPALKERLKNEKGMFNDEETTVVPD